MLVRGRRANGIALGAVLVFITRVVVGAADQPTVEPYPWVEDFGTGRLDPSRWERTAAGDFREWSVDVVDAPGPARPASSPAYRLRLRADTQGTRDDTVKHLGARLTQPISLREGREIAVQLDWADQANGSYLTAAVVLSPHATQSNPLDTPDWLKVAYVGVPPGRNARMLVETR